MAQAPSVEQASASAKRRQFRASAAAGRPKWRATTLGLRVLPLALLLAHAAGVFDLDGPTAGLWRGALRQSWSRWCMLEGLVAAGSFGFWILWFRFLDCFAVVKQFRLVPRPATQCWPAGRELPAPIQDLREALANLKAPSERNLRAIRVWGSLPGYLGAIWLFHLVRTPPPVEETPPSFLRLAGELVLGIWAYDFVFYWLHLIMHLAPKLRHGHMCHHVLSGGDGRSPDGFLEAEAVVNHSFFDGFLQVATNIVVQNLPLLGVPKHKLSRLLHNVAVTYLLTEAHAGLDLPWGSHRLLPGVLGGAPRHEVHHHLHKCCFHQFFTYLDDVLGFGPPPGTLVGWD